MIGLGTIINVLGIFAGGLLGLFCGKFMKQRYQDILTKSTGVCVIFIGVGGALEKMMTINQNQLNSGGTMMMIGSLAIGSVLGEFLNIDMRMAQFGEWLKIKTGNGKEQSFVEAFVTASLTVCVGAMAIIGAIQDGISGDYRILAAKAVLDLIIILVMTSSLGKGCIFAAIPVALLQGGVTVIARLVGPFMTEPSLSNLSLTGSILIFCVGINLIWKNTIKVANMLPSIIIAIIWAFLSA